jgi:transposase-like protein
MPALRMVGITCSSTERGTAVRRASAADRLLAEGADVDAVCRHLEVSVQTHQRWRAQFKAMWPEDAPLEAASFIGSSAS